MLSIIGAMALIALYFSGKLLSKVSDIVDINFEVPNIAFQSLVILFTLGVVGTVSMMGFSSKKVQVGLKVATVVLDGAFIVLSVVTVVLWELAARKMVALFFSGMIFLASVYMFILIEDISEMLKSMRRGERVGSGLDAGRRSGSSWSDKSGL